MSNKILNKKLPETSNKKSEDSNIILIVEDDPILSKMYREKFTFEGFSVLTARDGEEGLKMALEEKVDLILLDIMLPKMSGVDLLEKLRQDPKGKVLPVIALTNLAQQEEKKKSQDLGIKDYLVKAMQTPEEVVNKVKEYLK